MDKQRAIEYLKSLTKERKDDSEEWFDGYCDGISKGIEAINDMFSDDMERITRKMKEARDYVDSYIESNGYSPTYIEVAEYFGLNSTSVSYHRLRGYRHKMKIK